MDVRTCKYCRRIYNYLSGPNICPGCREKLEEKFQEVKAYIQDNKGVGMHEVSEACDVEVAQIRQWLREERLELTENSAIVLSCESCGAPIRCGRFCEKCKGALVNSMQSVMKSNAPEAPMIKKKEKDSAKMRFL